MRAADVVTLPLLLDGALGAVIAGLATVGAAWYALRHEQRGRNEERFEDAIADFEARADDARTLLRSLISSPSLADVNTWERLWGIRSSLRRPAIAVTALAERLPRRRARFHRLVGRGLLSEVGTVDERLTQLMEELPKGPEAAPDEIDQVLATEHALTHSAVLDLHHQLVELHSLTTWWNTLNMLKRNEREGFVLKRWPELREP